MDSLQRKGINFDLNTQALKEYYPKGDWHNAYADVRDFFEANGFEHIQGSGYHSVEAMSEAKAMAVIYQMNQLSKNRQSQNKVKSLVPYGMANLKQVIAKQTKPCVRF